MSTFWAVMLMSPPGATTSLPTMLAAAVAVSLLLTLCFFAIDQTTTAYQAGFAGLVEVAAGVDVLRDLNVHVASYFE
jgi:hypothetical protein